MSGFICSVGKSKANQGWTPLHLAAYFGHKDVVKALLEVREMPMYLCDLATYCS